MEAVKLQCTIMPGRERRENAEAFLVYINHFNFDFDFDEFLVWHSEAMTFNENSYHLC